MLRLYCSMERVVTNLSAPTRQAGVNFVLITIFIDVLSFGLIIPVLPHLIQGFYGGDQGQAATVSGWLSSGYWVLQFLFSPLIGALGDRYGRRPILLASNLAIGFDFIMMALAQAMPLLVIGRLLNGLVSANFSTAAAYIADVTAPEKRVQAFGMMGAAFGMGFVVGPALGGFLAHVDQRLPFWVAAAMALANFCYGYFILPESHKPENRMPVTWARANPVSALMWLKDKPALFGLVSISFLASFAHVVYPSIFVMYADYRYHWNELTVGLTLGAVGVMAAIVQGGLIKKLQPILRERRMMLIGLTCAIIGYAGYGLAPLGWIFWLVMPIMAFGGLVGPAVMSLSTGLIGPTEQGRLQGATNSLSSLANIVGPVLFTQAFNASIQTGEKSGALGIELPGISFLIAAVLMLIALAVAWKVARNPEKKIVQPAVPSEQF
jgi:MFS transporter, DHA1 family, tetracycline resistance protein